jgi:FkbM family methyltransferase
VPARPLTRARELWHRYGPLVTQSRLLAPGRGGALARGPETIAPLLYAADRALNVADVGARWGVSDMWEPFGDRVTVWAFEPDADECRRLQALVPPGLDRRYVALALGAADREATLHLTEDPGGASLFPPSAAAIARHPALTGMRERERATIALRRLDGWAAETGVSAIDAMKLDVQGAEVAVLEGAGDVLGSVRALEVEVEFNALYEGQPLFGDVDRLVRERGFALWRLGGLVHYGLTGTEARYGIPDVQYTDSRTRPVFAQGGQLSWGHAYYVAADLVDGRPGATWSDHVRDAAVASAFGWRDLAAASLLRGRAAAPAEQRGTLDGALASC